VATRGLTVRDNPDLGGINHGGAGSGPAAVQSGSRQIKITLDRQIVVIATVENATGR
jgi:hypothetical protein